MWLDPLFRHHRNICEQALQRATIIRRCKNSLKYVKHYLPTSAATMTRVTMCTTVIGIEFPKFWVDKPSHTKQQKSKRYENKDDDVIKYTPVEVSCWGIFHQLTSPEITWELEDRPRRSNEDNWSVILYTTGKLMQEVANLQSPVLYVLGNFGYCRKHLCWLF